MKSNTTRDKTIFDAIGNTPLIKVGNVYAKLETTNPTGSVKDRIAIHMIEKAEARGELKPGSKIIEATSGNSGISLAMVSAVKGYKFIAVMPEFMSIERRKMIQAFGAKLVLTPAKEEIVGMLIKCAQLAKENPDAWLPRQFENPDNVEAIEQGLGQEIISAFKGKEIDAFVAGIGTGGTIIGVGRALKKVYPNIKIVGVEPAESAVLSGGKPGHHLIEGIGEGFVPKIVERHRNVIDEVIMIRDKDAIAESERLAREDGILVGLSSGANILAAEKMRAKLKNVKKKDVIVVTILPDRGERYLSERKY